MNGRKCGGGVKVKGGKKGRKSNRRAIKMRVGDKQREVDKGEKRQKKERGSDVVRENSAPWPPIFIHQRRTSGNCLSVSECMDGQLAACKEAIMSLLSLVSSSLWLSFVGTADPLCSKRHDAHCHTVSLHHSCIPPLSPSKLVCFHKCTNTFQQCRQKMGS